MIIILDNYDSFTYNLVQYVGAYDPDIKVVRNDACTTDEIINKKPSGIIISPGPGFPDKAGICIDLIKQVSETNIPLLGICLGHQAIGQAFGGTIVKAPKPVHGKTSLINHNEEILYRGIKNPMKVTRYHSLVIETDTCPDCLDVTATSDENIIMSVKHKTKQIFGVQYHPESIATDDGKLLIKNFVELTK